MIPLRTPAILRKFPTAVFFTIAITLVMTLLFSSYHSSSDSLRTRTAASLIIFPSWPLGLLCSWYLWIFYPSHMTRTGKNLLLDFMYPVFALLIVIGIDFLGIEAGWGFVFSVMIFGSVMRDLIWDNVDTLVIGPRLFSVFAVPCYVHAFFFLFYIFLAQLISPAFGMPGKTIYTVSLISFFAGFLVRTGELKGLKADRTSLY